MSSPASWTRTGAVWHRAEFKEEEHPRDEKGRFTHGGDQIVKILQRVDTREWEEGGDDRWHAIPGSGNPNKCDRCGKTHEIHYHAELASGKTAIIGGGCARQENLTAVKRFDTVDKAEQKVRDLEESIKQNETKAADWEKTRMDLEEHKPKLQRTDKVSEIWPERGIIPHFQYGDGEEVALLRVGTDPIDPVKGWATAYDRTINMAKNSWLNKRLEEKGLPTYNKAKMDADYDKQRIGQARARLYHTKMKAQAEEAAEKKQREAAERQQKEEAEKQQRESGPSDQPKR